MKKKHYSYKELFERAENALNSEYYLEASWICSAIIEDRLVSILNHTGGSLKPNGNKIIMIGPKINEINKRMVNDIKLKNVFYDKIIDDISSWTQLRNDLMHALAVDRSYKDSFNDIRLLGEMGIKLAKELSTRARKLKRQK